MKNKSSKGEIYAIELMNIDYIDVDGSYVDGDFVYLHIDKSKIPTPEWIFKDNPLKYYLDVFALTIMCGDSQNWIPKDQRSDNTEFYIIYEVNPSSTEFYAGCKINRFAVNYNGKMHMGHGDDDLRAVLDMAEIEGYPESERLHSIYDKFIEDVENVILAFLQKKLKIKGEIVGKALHNNACVFIQKKGEKNVLRSVENWHKLLQQQPVIV